VITLQPTETAPVISYSILQSIVDSIDHHSIYNHSIGLVLRCYLLVYSLDVEYFQTTLTGCHGAFFWTAGQRIDPSRESTFVWRVKSTDTHSETVTEMTYSNWYPGEPNNYGDQVESCMHLWGYGRSYTWNDEPCSRETCSVCEIDI